jgi:hypothetical protein
MVLMVVKIISVVAPLVVATLALVGWDTLDSTPLKHCLPEILVITPHSIVLVYASYTLLYPLIIFTIRSFLTKSIPQ